MILRDNGNKKHVNDRFVAPGDEIFATAKAAEVIGAGKMALPFEELIYQFSSFDLQLATITKGLGNDKY